MSRPKANEPGLSAIERIKESFWQLIEEMPYNEISIKQLASEAKVNHKTIYYYYENIDAIAEKLFEENITLNFSKNNPLIALLSGRQEDLITTQIDEISARRVLLYCKSDSPFLNAIFKKHIQKNWLRSLGINEQDLANDEKVDLEFILSGMIALIGQGFPQNDPFRILRIFDRDLGQAVRSTFLKIEERNKK